jgi:hypothetical protein
MTDASIGYGSKFKVWNEDLSPAAYEELAEVVSITPPSDTIDMIDATHMQSPNRYREFIQGLIDGGECSLEINWMPGNDTDARLRAIKAAGEAIQCQIQYPNFATHTFTALLTGYAPTDPLDDVMRATVTWKVTGPVVAAGGGSP